MISRVLAEDDSVQLESNSRDASRIETPLRLRKSQNENSKDKPLPDHILSKEQIIADTPMENLEKKLGPLDPVREEPMSRVSIS